MVASLAIVAGVALITAGGASAAVVPKAAAPTLPCTVSVSGGGQLAAGTTLITGVVAGTTQIKFDCNASSGAAVVAEASLLAGLGATSVVPTTEADTTSLGTFTASATDTGCPAGTAGSCTVATFAVPATFTATDANAKCPPTQTQINEGIFGCAVAVANSTEAEVAGGEYLVQYASQTTAPSAPTISAQPASGSANSLINVSDATGATGYWWGDAIQAVQALNTGGTTAVAPSTCSAGGGYGNVPSSMLEEAWYVPGSSTPVSSGPATGVTISNDCYTGSTLQPPVLSGTMTVPAAVTTGTSYTVYLCEVNATPYPSNDASASKVCGSGAPSYIDASFAFKATAKTLSQNLPVAASVTTAASTGFTAQLASSGNTGTVTYTQTAGTPNIIVSGSGAVTTKGALAAGTYTASGTTADPNGDSGTFTYALTVTGTTVVTTPAPRATRVVGYGIVGRTTTVTITGKNFTAGPRIIGHAGTVASVVRTTPTRIVVKVRVVKTAKKGSYRFTIQFRNGKKTSVVYTIRK
ncbi:MAG TPA: hypothetical protein VG246_06290 [Acidimicrobiales bacterium]|nr:hypothetical protein [Acidimicrobiales bacterium]